MSAPNGLLGQYHDAAASRKRKASEHETEEHYGTAAAGAKRVNNGARSSLRGSAPPFQPQTGSPAFAPNAHNALFSGLPNLPPFPPGPLPPADFISMMAAFGKAMPGMPPLPVLKKNKEKCSHYYTKGHCALGTLCQFVHGDDAKFVPGDDPGFLHGDDATPANRIPEYDPQQSALSMQQQTTSRTIVNGRHGTNGTHANSVSRRALVVERIPEESHNAGNVRAYFSQFGTITEVKSQVNRAIVTFEDHASAQKALDSPKAVFDNRFVKVSWYQPTELAREASPGSYGDVEMLAAKGYDAWPPLDLEAIAKRQAESQKLFEERQRKKNEVDAKAADIDKKLLKTDLEIKAIKHQIAELACDASGYSEEQTGHQLANLDTTLESLFKAGGPAPHELRSDVPGQAFNDSVSFPPSGRSWRGRFEFPGRRSFRGRGGFEGRGAYMAVKRLDFRPRRLVVSNIEEGSAKRKVLMRYLVVCLIQVAIRQRELTGSRDFPDPSKSTLTPSSQTLSLLRSRSATKLRW
jgi:RNA recognition motif-containing protein